MQGASAVQEAAEAAPAPLPEASPACPPLQVLLLMQVPPAGEADRLAKAALYTKFTETLPAAVRRWRDLGVPLLLELLGGLRAAVEGGAQGGGRGGRLYAQQLFSQAQAFLQVANVLNEEYPQVRPLMRLQWAREGLLECTRQGGL